MSFNLKPELDSDLPFLLVGFNKKSYSPVVSSTSSIVNAKYLKSAEVMEMLQVSPGTLQNLRINGTLPYTKIGGIILYEYEEILEVLKVNRVAS